MTWSTTAPTEEGVYWLYGDPCFGAMGGDYTGVFEPKKKLHYVTVIRISNGVIAACNGQYVSLQPFNKEKRREGWIGVWQPVVLPTLPAT